MCKHQQWFGRTFNLQLRIKSLTSNHKSASVGRGGHSNYSSPAASHKILAATFMESTKSLRRPINWQDFETLCKKLWGEIWNCPEIKKNGRMGQLQNGVDIYGIPKGETEYYGIQCKGKDEYSDKQFSEKEILIEIENAQYFKPGLKKLYFATTALKDAYIETFIREKNIEQVRNGLFEVHLFSWEDIVDLIDENRHTHDWYLKSQNFKTKKEAKITFADDLFKIDRAVFFLKVVYDSNQRFFPSNSTPDNLSEYTYIPITSARTNTPSDFSTLINISYLGFQIKIQNTGSESIEEYNIELDFTGQILAISETNEIENSRFTSSNIPSTPINSLARKIKIIPGSMLVSGDYFVSKPIFIKPTHDEKTLSINWKLFAKDFTESGNLIINIIPNLEGISVSELMEYPSKVGNKNGDIVEYLVPKSYLE